MARKTTVKKTAPKKTTRPKGDPREWLRKKLGKVAYAEFEKGMLKGAAAAAKGKPKGKVAEVEGQAPCSGYCWSYCSSFAIQSGYWSSWFRLV